MDKETLTKSERKVLATFVNYREMGQLEQHRGKFYWGGEVVGSRPVTIGAVYESLHKKGFIEYIHGSVPRYGGIYRKTEKYKGYQCRNKIGDRYCYEGHIFTGTHADDDNWQKEKCSACNGTGLQLVKRSE